MEPQAYAIAVDVQAESSPLALPGVLLIVYRKTAKCSCRAKDAASPCFKPLL